MLDERVLAQAKKIVAIVAEEIARHRRARHGLAVVASLAIHRSGEKYGLHVGYRAGGTVRDLATLARPIGRRLAGLLGKPVYSGAYGPEYTMVELV